MSNVIDTIREVDGSAPYRILTPEMRSGRLERRLLMLKMIGLTFVVDLAILALFCLIDVIAFSILLAYAACAVIYTSTYGLIARSGVTDYLRDHYAVSPFANIGVIILIAFTYAAPQIGLHFIVIIFVIVSFCSLRIRFQQAAIIWLIASTGLLALYGMTDLAIALPTATLNERLLSALALILTIGRCTLLGIFASLQRHALFRRGQELNAANRRLRKLAEIDNLTGTYNRRSISKIFADELARFAQAPFPLSIALLDLDWFKQVNDRYGHSTGDIVLKTFAMTINSEIRSEDRLGRYGGEEFLLIMPNTDEYSAQQALDRLLAIVASVEWVNAGPQMRITFSGGVAQIHTNETFEDAISRADTALYEAKRSGRNKIIRSMH